jgi:hypothetical protein
MEVRHRSSSGSQYDDSEGVMHEIPLASEDDRPPTGNRYSSGYRDFSSGSVTSNSDRYTSNGAPASKNKSNRKDKNRRSSTLAVWAVVLLTLALILMIFVAVTPISKLFYLFSVDVHETALIDTVSDSFQFGTWGYCSTGVKNS